MPKTRKPTAAEERLNALLGLTEKVAEVQTRANGRFYGVSEDEIQNFRQAQGLVYFLQAPALFHAKKCKHCGEPFLVSRMFVALCSYTCIRKDLEARGFKWTKGEDIEEVVKDPQVYDGNEPIWIRQPQLSQALKVLQSLLENSEEVPPTPLSPQPPVDPEKPLSSTMKDTDTSSPPTTTTGIGTTAGTTLLKKKGPSRKITFGD